MTEGYITFTQGLFLCCLFIFGPAFGFAAVYFHHDSRIGGFWAFLFAAFSAYAGWFASGIAALLVHPDYGTHHGPSELVASTFVIPGFLSGFLGLQILKTLSNRAPGIRRGEQAGTGQPATRPVDKPEGSYKPQPEAEGRCP
jgi:hypothetical protein